MDEARVAVITGAAAGIGKACANRFRQDGYRVAAGDLNGDRLDLLAQDDGIVGVPTDVTRAEDCDRLAEAALGRWGRIDVLVANAGLQFGEDFMSTTESDWNRVFAVNLSGVRNACRAVTPAMTRRRVGAMVLVASVNVVYGGGGMAAYDASKAGVVAMARSLACELGKDGIRVNAVSPGNTITDFHIDRMAAEGKTVDDIRAMTRGYGLLGRAAEPAEIAGAIAFLAGDDATFLTGHNLVVDGGYSVGTAGE